MNIDADTIRADQNALIFRLNGIRLLNKQTEDADVRKMLSKHLDELQPAVDALIERKHALDRWGGFFRGPEIYDQPG